MQGSSLRYVILHSPIYIIKKESKTMDFQLIKVDLVLNSEKSYAFIFHESLWKSKL